MRKPIKLEAYTEKRYRVGNKTFSSHKEAKDYFEELKRGEQLEKAEKYIEEFVANIPVVKRQIEDATKTIMEDYADEDDEWLNAEITDARMDNINSHVTKVTGGFHCDELVPAVQGLIHLLGITEFIKFVEEYGTP